MSDAEQDGVKTGVESTAQEVPPTSVEAVDAECMGLAPATLEERIAAWWRGDGLPDGSVPVMAPGTVSGLPNGAGS
jgi:hypothetical protein